MSDQPSADLRAALARHAAEVPSSASARLLKVDYHPRSPRRFAALALSGTAGLAAIAGAVMAIMSLSTGTQAAFAGWSTSPTMPAGGQTAAAESACLAHVPSAADSERARHDGTAHAPVMEALLKIAPDEWHPVLADTRGSFTMIMLEAANGQAQASCLSSSSSAVLSVGPVGGHAGSVAAGQAQVVSTGSQGAPSGHPFTYTEGRVGANVTGVTIVLNDGTHVSATIANGHFAAWWPGSQQAISQEVTASGRTSTDHVEDASSTVATSTVR